MYHTDVKNNEITRLIEKTVGIIDKKTTTIKIKQMPTVYPLTTDEIWTNEKIKFLKREFKGKKDPSLQTIRKVVVVDHLVNENTYFLASRGFTCKGSRVARKKNSSGSIDTILIEYLLTSFIFPYIYMYKDKKYDIDELAKSYNQEDFYIVNTLLNNFVADSISKEETDCMFKILQKDKTVRQFIWDIELLYSKVKLGVGKVYKAPNPFNVTALDDMVFELGDFYSFFREIIKSFMFLPYYNFMDKMDKLNNDSLPKKAHIRSMCFYKVIIEIDEGLDVDPSLILPNGVSYPIERKIEDGYEKL